MPAERQVMFQQTFSDNQQSENQVETSALSGGHSLIQFPIVKVPCVCVD